MTAPATLQPSPTFRHKVTVEKWSTSITADCVCGAGIESEGHDLASREAIAGWMTKHEAGA